MSNLLSIDVGTRNMGACIINAVTQQVVAEHNVDLLRGARYTKRRVREGLVTWFRVNRSMLADLKWVIIENQMKKDMTYVEGILFGLFSEVVYLKVDVVHPRSVKAYWAGRGERIRGKDYHDNKRLASQLFTKLRGTAAPNSHVADAYLQALYYANKILY